MRHSLRLIPIVVLALGSFASTACATGYAYGQGRARDRGPYGGYGDGRYDRRELQRVAYDNGFRDGVRAGERDGRKNKRYEPSRDRDWRNADAGYRRGYGDLNLYRRSFRDGFEAGYDRGYRQYARGNRRW